MPSVSDDHEFSIRCDDVSVTYRTSIERKPTLKSAIRRLGRRERVIREVHALKNVNFRVKRGAVYGVVGANGAGKSTLMRTITGILPPTEGRVEVNGRVSTLLALGVGFNKDLTGRENVVLGGMAAGIPREAMEEKYEEIVAFAELEDFMDMPMRTYSSGMYARLGFSVAVHMDPDILVIDEALSVGDAKFRKKSSREDEAAVRRGPHDPARHARDGHRQEAVRPRDLDPQGRGRDEGPRERGREALHEVPQDVAETTDELALEDF